LANGFSPARALGEEAAKALTHAVLTWRDDQTMQPHGFFRGFEILSKGKSSGFGLCRRTTLRNLFELTA
jgi:hypothetical protein